ncbi:hypothetical protein Emag_003185 [Eimeria magna]
MADNHPKRSAVDRHQGGAKKEVSKTSSKKLKKAEVPSGRKKKRWFQPKDKSQLRKRFLKVRDARARSDFSKLQKKSGLDTTATAAAEAAAATTAEAAAADSNESSLPPIGSVDDDNDVFLQRLMDPFARAKCSTYAADGDPSSGQQMEATGSKRKIKGRREGSNASAASAGTDAASVTTPHPPSSGERDKGLIEDRASPADSKSRGEVLKGVQRKGYMPFLKAQKAFEAKQREKEAARRAREEEARKIAVKRKEKERLDRLAYNKLKARTKKGQMVMGNVLDVLLLKLQKNARE